MKSEDQARMHENPMRQSFYKRISGSGRGLGTIFTSHGTVLSRAVEGSLVLEKIFAETEWETESWIMEGEGKPPPYNYGAISTDANYQQPPPPYPAGGKYVSW